MGKYTFEYLKKAINTKDLIEAKKSLHYLFINDRENFKRNLLLSGCLIDPLSRKFSKNHLELLESASSQVVSLITDQSEKKSFIELISKILFTMKILAKAGESNYKRLSQNDFLKMPFTKQVQMYCTFIESQTIYANKEIRKKTSTQGFFTPLETEFPYSDSNISISDSLEGNLELFDTIFRLLKYTAEKNDRYENQSITRYSDVSPYNVPSIQEIMLLASHRKLLEEIWSNFKYRNWDFGVYKDNDFKKVFYFRPIDKENYKREKSATFRYKHTDMINVLKNLNGKKIKNFNKILNQKFEFVLNDPNFLFNVNKKNFNYAKEIIENNLNSIWQEINEEFGEDINKIKFGEKKNLDIFDFFNGLTYLQTISYFYQTLSHEKFDDTDFSYLAPVLDINDIVKHFSMFNDIELEKANDIIEIFIFRGDNLGDVFSQPLIYSGNLKVVFTPYIVSQLNIKRTVNKILSNEKIDTSFKGLELESTIKELLSYSKIFRVNTTKVSFLASDGKDVEYDLIAEFDGKIVLIEMKCLNIPYSQKEIKQREVDVFYGVQQVNRREKILIDQWDEVQSRLDIPIKISNPQANDIIKIVCTNIYEFTGRIEDGVFITDISSLLKFFLDSTVEKIKFDFNSQNTIKEINLWNREPKTFDLLSYLKSPITVESLMSKFVETPRTIPLIEIDDERLAFFDYILEDNPYKEFKRPSYKVERNSLCICGSKIKYKKCHGKN